MKAKGQAGLDLADFQEHILKVLSCWRQVVGVQTRCLGVVGEAQDQVNRPH